MSSLHLMERRQFLIVSSRCAAAAAAIVPSLKLFAANTTAAAVQPKRLSVGFATFEDADTLGSASNIPAADGGFIGRGARVSVSGASGASSKPRERRAVELLVNHSYLDGAERRTAPFRAWACSRTTGCQGNQVNFTVPVDEVQHLSLTIGAETGTPAGTKGPRRLVIKTEAADSVALPLTFGLQHDAPVKLARGYYVIVPIFEGDSDPSWSSYSLRIVEGRWSLVGGNDAVAPFEHFVLRIDYAAR